MNRPSDQPRSASAPDNPESFRAEPAAGNGTVSSPGNNTPRDTPLNYSPAEPGSRWPFAVRALGSRNFRLFFTGQLISFTGSWVSTATSAWLVYELSGKNALLGWSAFCAQISTFLLAPFAGVWVDRMNLQRTILATQCLSAVQSLLLALLCWTGVLEGMVMVKAILALQLLQGVINAFDMPARQSFGILMVDRREDLPNAIALNSTIVNLSRFIGPALAGLVIAALSTAENKLRGPAWCYTLDVASYLAVIAALLRMRTTPIPRAVARTPFFEQMREGYDYVARHPTLRTVLILQCFVSFFGIALNTQIASIAKSQLSVGPQGYGYLFAAVGLGATVSALFLATRRTTAGIPRLISYASVLFGITLAALSLTHVYALAVPLMAVIGACMILQSAGTNTLCQTLSDDDKRGRVMSFFTMSFMGMVPMGALALGYGAEKFGTERAVLAGGAAVLIAALLAGPTLRRVSGVRTVPAQAAAEATNEASEEADQAGR